MERNHFRRDLELLYASGYRPVTVSEVVDRKIDLPAGLSPVVFTFDDAGPSQFSYIDHNGTLEIDPNSAVGIWLAFHKEHPDWRNKATFCLLSGRRGGTRLLRREGNRGTEIGVALPESEVSRRSGIRAVRTHALAREPREVQRRSGAGADRARHVGDRFGGAGLSRAHVCAAARRVAEEPGARGVGRVEESARGEDHALRLRRGARRCREGRPRSPYDASFDPKRLTRIEVFGNALERALGQLDASGSRYVSDGDPATVARPAATKVVLGRSAR